MLYCFGCLAAVVILRRLELSDSLLGERLPDLLSQMPVPLVLEDAEIRLLKFR